MAPRQLVIAAAAAAALALAISFHLVTTSKHASLSAASRAHLLAHINATVASAVSTAIDRSRLSLSDQAPPPPLVSPRDPSLPPVTSLPPAERALRDAQARVNYSTIFMSPIEADVVLRHLVAFLPPNSTHPHPAPVRTYVEWGSGGSTTNFAQFATQRAYSIEHTAEWCARMRPKIAAHPALHNLTYRCVDLPFGNSAEGNYEKYRVYVDEIAALNETVFDIVLVDGRARVSCAIKALSYIAPQSVVVLHDAHRVNDPPGVNYKPVLDYYDVVDSVGGEKRQGLFVLRRKPEFNRLQGQHADVQRILDQKTGLF